MSDQKQTVTDVPTWMLHNRPDTDDSLQALIRVMGGIVAAAPPYSLRKDGTQRWITGPNSILHLRTEADWETMRGSMKRTLEQLGEAQAQAMAPVDEPLYTRSNAALMEILDKMAEREIALEQIARNAPKVDATQEVVMDLLHHARLYRGFVLQQMQAVEVLAKLDRSQKRLITTLSPD